MYVCVSIYAYLSFSSAPHRFDRSVQKKNSSNICSNTISRISTKETFAKLSQFKDDLFLQGFEFSLSLECNSFFFDNDAFERKKNIIIKEILFVHEHVDSIKLIIFI